MPHHFLIDALPFVDVRHIFSCPGPETSREAVGFILAELLGENGLPGIKNIVRYKKNVPCRIKLQLFLSDVYGTFCLLISYTYKLRGFSSYSNTP